MPTLKNRKWAICPLSKAPAGSPPQAKIFFENPRLRLNLPRRIGTRGRTRGRGKSVLRPVEGFVARHVEAHPKKQDARARLYTQEPRRCRSSVAFGAWSEEEETEIGGASTTPPRRRPRPRARAQDHEPLGLQVKAGMKLTSVKTKLTLTVRATIVTWMLTWLGATPVSPRPMGGCPRKR